MRSISFGCLVLLMLTGCSEPERVLVFSKTEGYRQGSIPAGIEAVQQEAAALGYAVTATEDAGYFSEDSLQAYRAIVFLNTSGDVLDAGQQTAFKRFIQAGGGFVGVHRAAETEPAWTWYGQLVGGRMGEPLHTGQPAHRMPVRTAALAPSDSLPAAWELEDAWYHLRPTTDSVDVWLERADGTPAAWSHAFDGGRAAYLAPGHTAETFGHASVRQLLAGALEFAVGDAPVEFSKARALPMPEPERFRKVVLAENLFEPVELTPLPDGRVLFIERRGAVKLYEPATGVQVIDSLEVYYGHEDGIMGLVADPNFEDNSWVYLFHSLPDTAIQRLSRFTLAGSPPKLIDQVPMLDVTNQRESCCHTGGSMAFDRDGNLFLSTGDNTNPWNSDGFAPLDEREGRGPYDAQKSSANTNDLRGKIVRITPQPDGSYTIPEGNLFAPDDSLSRPEIYTMGLRNPYRISVDQETGYLYWGDVGPDSPRADSTRGPWAFDEINQARGPGFFGWPYFVGDSQPYHDFDFETGESGPLFDRLRPVNDSPNNTGHRLLPPAQDAFIWYPYATSETFPILGTGGRTAMTGPVYRRPESASPHALPAYYDGKLLIYEWMRGWIMAVTMDENGDMADIEPFMPHVTFNNPMDLEFTEDGVLYALEYGTNWFAQNADARLVRIEYDAGNRAPNVRIAASETSGSAPFVTTLRAQVSDPENDAVVYSWTDGTGRIASTDSVWTVSLNEPGVHPVRLTVTDAGGLTETAELELHVGDSPDLRVQFAGNQTFYWAGRPLRYAVQSGNPSNGPAAPSFTHVSFDYVAEPFLSEADELGHQAVQEETKPLGQRLMEESNCTSCHATETASIGPSFVRIADRYQDDQAAIERLSQKVIAGGSGSWGDRLMPAHPMLSASDAGTMIRHILATGLPEEAGPSLPHEGELRPEAHLAKDAFPNGTYAFTARHAPHGSTLAAEHTLTLRPPRIEAESYDWAVHASRTPPADSAYARNLFDGSYLVFTDLDLTGVQTATLRALTDRLNNAGGTVSLRLDAPDGPVLSTFEIPAGDYAPRRHTLAAPLAATQGRHDVYVAISNAQIPPEPLLLIDWLEVSPESSR